MSLRDAANRAVSGRASVPTASELHGAAGAARRDAITRWTQAATGLGSRRENPKKWDNSRRNAQRYAGGRRPRGQTEARVQATPPRQAERMARARTKGATVKVLGKIGPAGQDKKYHRLRWSTEFRMTASEYQRFEGARQRGDEGGMLGALQAAANTYFPATRGSSTDVGKNPITWDFGAPADITRLDITPGRR
jgi:hypothetical protein